MSRDVPWAQRARACLTWESRASLSDVAIFEPIFSALNAAEVRYVVVGGVATVLHGHAHLTVDIDLVVDLAAPQATKVVQTLTAIGFVPRVPVAALDFADPEARSRWMRDKRMKVFPMIDPHDPLHQVDLFVESPIDFESLWNRAESISIGDIAVRVACIDDLIAMKRIAGRAQDLADIEALEAILEEKRKR